MSNSRGYTHQFLAESVKVTNSSADRSMSFIALHSTLEVPSFQQRSRDVQFLSRSATEMIARLIKSKKDLTRLEYTGLGNAIRKEILLRYGLHCCHELSSDTVQEPIPEGWNRDKWHVHEDPRFNHTLSTSFLWLC
jgi:hypothetical protein